LVRHPDGPRWQVVVPALETALRLQGSTGVPGAWPNPGAAEGISIWAVVPFIQAFHDVLQSPGLAGRGRRLSSLRGAVVIAELPTRSVARIVAMAALAKMATGLKRHRATAALTILVV